MTRLYARLARSTLQTAVVCEFCTSFHGVLFFYRVLNATFFQMNEPELAFCQTNNIFCVRVVQAWRPKLVRNAMLKSESRSNVYSSGLWGWTLSICFAIWWQQNFLNKFFLKHYIIIPGPGLEWLFLDLPGHAGKDSKCPFPYASPYYPIIIVSWELLRNLPQ